MVISVYLPNEIRAFALQPCHRARLATAFPRASLHFCATEKTFLARLPETTHALVWNFRGAWLPRATKLRCVATPAAGHEGIEVLPDARLTVLFGTFHGQLIAQTVLAQLLAFNRGILAAERLQRGGDAWPRVALVPHMFNMHGTHAVILGFGHIGQAIGALLKPFNIRVTGLRRDTKQPPPEWFSVGDRMLPVAELDAVLPTADHVICALPGTTRTTHLLNAKRLARLPRRAVVYNIGRGNAIDETALAKRLCAGRLRGALLDVFETEPLPADSPLRNAPNFYPLPHASAIAPDYLDLWLDECIPLLGK